MTSDVQKTKTRKKSGWWWLGVVGSAVAMIWVMVMCMGMGVWIGSRGSRDTTAAAKSSGEAVGVIRVEGTIGLSAASGGIESAEIIRYIEQAAEDPGIKALVIFINSPGGSVVPSAEMYEALQKVEKPIVAVMGDIAASGGYYIACGADEILAHPATMTGSIGVYGQMINAADLLDKLGVEGIIVRSGDSKAAGNWFEHPSEEQLAIRQAIVDELYDMFVDVVVEEREMDKERVRELADGRPYTGRQALEVGLIDKFGNLDDGIALAAELGEIEGEPEIIEYWREPTFFEMMFMSRQQVDEKVILLEWLNSASIPQMRYIGP